MRIDDGRGVFFAARVVGDERHRTRAVERGDGVDVVDGRDADLAGRALHAAGFELENADGFARVEQLIGLRVFEPEFFEVEDGIGGAAHVFHRVGEHGEGLEAEKVHLQQAELADRVHVELHGDVAFLRGQRHEVVQRLVGDDNAGGVFAGVAHHAFEHEALVDDFFGDRVAVVFALQLGGFLERIFERDVQLVGDHLGQTIGLGEGQVVHAGDIAHHHLGPEGAVGDDVGHAGVAVFLAHVVDHLDAAAHAEIDVEVGRRHALRVKETLEKQPEANGVDIGNAEQIRDQTTGAGTAPWADRDGVLAGPVDKIPHYEEVVVEAGDVDDRELVAGAQDEQFVGGEAGVIGGSGFLAGR